MRARRAGKTVASAGAPAQKRHRLAVVVAQVGEEAESPPLFAAFINPRAVTGVFGRRPPSAKESPQLAGFLVPDKRIAEALVNASELDAHELA